MRAAFLKSLNALGILPDRRCALDLPLDLVLGWLGFDLLNTDLLYFGLKVLPSDCLIEPITAG